MPVNEPLDVSPKRTINKKKLVIWVILLGLVVAAVLLLLFRNGWPLSERKVIEESISTEINPADFQEWVVYNNPLLKISMEIPPEWSIDEERDQENQPTGVIRFLPSSSATESPAEEILLSVGKTREGMSGREEFELHKNSRQFSQPVGGYLKLGTTQAKNGEALAFQKENAESFELLGWMYNGETPVFIETRNSNDDKKAAILFHRYILSTVSLL